MFERDKLKGITAEISRITGSDNFLTDDVSRALYCYDSGLTKALPEGVINITDTSLIQPIVKLLYSYGIPFTARGAGTNLSGGTIALKGGVILNLAPLNKIIEINTKNEYALVEPGVVNITLQNELEKLRFFYAPDPASQKACTIGGNLGENAGGPRCLKYGVTLNNILQAEFITPQGEKLYLTHRDAGPDLLGLMIGSEGTLGIASTIKLKIIKTPDCIKAVLVGFESMDDAMQSVTTIIASGVVPCTIEVMDKLTVQASEKYSKAGYPTDCQAVLLIEFDGTEESVENEKRISLDICKKNNSLVQIYADSEHQRQKLLQGRKGAFAAMARLAPNVSVEDGVVPRPMLPEALREIRKILDKYNLKAGLVCHAGDGNIHPNIILDERNSDETNRVKKAGREILKKCVELGGAISGEHGIGVEKRFAMNWLFTKTEIEVFRKIKKALDPSNIANPDKIIPVSSSSGENFIRPAYFENSSYAKEIIGEVSKRYKHKTKSFIICCGTKTDRTSCGNMQLLDLSGIRKILKIDKQNYTLTVESGIKLTDLHHELADENLFINLPNGESSLGGLIACKSFYPAGNIVLAMTVLFPNGETAFFGANTVKNVSGYDVCRLMLGSWGTYGIILNATFKLSSRRENITEPLLKPHIFKPDKIHIGLKKAVDEFNLFNPYIFGDL